MTKIKKKYYNNLYNSYLNFPKILYKIFFIKKINYPLNNKPKNFLITFP